MKKKLTRRKIILLLLLIVIIALPICFMISKYYQNESKLQYTFSQTTSENMVSYPNAKFAVISDLHYYDLSLGTTGSAFEKCLNSDRKLLKNSADLLNLAINNIIRSRVEFVLVPGDLTKDGELICHQKVALALSKLTKNGIKVYVVPGNHDVNNPLAYKYEGDKSISVPNITPTQFSEIYKDYGYKNAIYRDTNTLSYVAEPVKNLWVVALDTCRYKDNKPGKEETVGGKLSQAEENWLTKMLKLANENKKAVIVLEHHGVVEHWTGQSKLHPDYLIQDYKNIGKLMASYDVRLAFTGHYHAQDITLSNFGNSGFLYDIETGSLITAPCAVRYCTIQDNKILIKSDDLVDKLYPGTNFGAKAKQFVIDTIVREAVKTLRNYHVSSTDSQYIANYVGAAFVAHYKGDENITHKPAFNENKLGLWSRIVYSQEKYVIKGLWHDLPPTDNNATLDLSKN